MIHLTDTPYPAGTVIVAAGMTPRYYEFQLALEQLGAPVGTKQHIERSCDIASNFNGGISKMIGEWVWFLGDDHSFEPDMLMRLLAYNVDIVVPPTPCKGIPFMPCIMHGTGDPDVLWHPELPLYHWDEISGEGLYPLPVGDFIGQAGMLVKKHVLDKVGSPWFKCGQLDPGRLQEDMWFCHEVQKLGYTVYIDQEQVLNHHMITNITARKHEGKWSPALKFGNDTMILPDAKPKAAGPPKNFRDGKNPVQWAPLPTGVQ